MTTVVYRDGILAADSRLTEGGRIWDDNAPKVHKHFGYLLGAAGERAAALEFRHWFITGMRGSPPAPRDTKDKSTTYVIVTPEGMVIEHQWEGFVQHHSEYYAVGSGSAYALGAMAQGATAIQAVKAAKQFDIYTGGDVHYVEL